MHCYIYIYNMIYIYIIYIPMYMYINIYFIHALFVIFTNNLGEKTTHFSKTTST